MPKSGRIHDNHSKRHSHARDAHASRTRAGSPERRPRIELDAKNLVLSILALVLFYLIAVHSLPAGVSETLPELALMLNGSNPKAATVFVQQRIVEEAALRQGEASTSPDTSTKAKQPSLDIVTLSKLLQRSIPRDPVNAEAFRLLAELALREGRLKTGRRLMAEAVNLSIGETTAVTFMMGERLAAERPRAALGYADILMRSHQNSLAPVAQLVTRMAENPGARKELVARLGAAPPWRKQLFNSFATSGITRLDTPLDLLIALKDTPNPPTEEELNGYINLLMKWRLYPLAYSTWVQFLDGDRLSEVANLFNGSFEKQPSGLPFDWMIGKNAATLAGIFALPEDQDRSALFIRFGQVRSAFPTIRQTVVLGPGAYSFTGKMRGEILARRGLQWRVTCVNGKNAGESQMLVGRFPEWGTFSFEISVPEVECPAQIVELRHMARTPSEQTAAGSVWFDDLAITRESSSVASP